MEFYDKVVELLNSKQNLLYKMMMLNSLVDEYLTDDNAKLINEDLRDAFGTVGLSPIMNSGEKW